MHQIVNIIPTRLVLLIPLIFLFGCSTHPLTPKGPLSGEILWEGTVHIDGDLIVEKGGNLTIRPGTTVIFLPTSEESDSFTDHPHFVGNELIVRGTILAEGSPSAPITFRHINPSAPEGSWGGINIMGATNARFRYCRFMQADSALHAQESRVLVEESLFEQNLVAIRFHTTEIRIANNLIRNNVTGIRFHFGSPEIVSNEISDNGKNFFITSYPRNYKIEGNNITGHHVYNVVLGEEVPEDVIMKGNYWGCSTPMKIATTLFDGRTDTDLGRVEFEPFSLHAFPKAGLSWNP